MDLRAHLLALVAPHQVGDEVTPGAILLGASSELGLRLRFDIGGRMALVEVAPAGDPIRPHAARTPRLLFSYLAGAGSSAIAPSVGLALCRAVAQLAAPREAGVLDRLAREAARARLVDGDAHRVREVLVERLLEPAGSGDERYLTLTPYVGCLIGCRFCYAQTHVAAVRGLAGLPAARWGSFVDARMNAAAVLERELANAPSLPVKLCPIVSDPYQAIEERYRITRACLEVLAAAHRPTLVLTRARLIERDLALLASFPEAWAGFSIPTLDDDARRHFEPRAAPIGERLAALSSLRAAGVRTFAVVQPILPGPIDALADALAGAVSSVSLGVLRGVEGAADEFSDGRYPDAASDTWQRAAAVALGGALGERGVALWPGDLPSELRTIRP